ncbi:hypothetical protein VD0001_g5020 [Verticillium dahliae]|nr:hypothetical protein VD0001_g5020 [Verticillium dahliae]
MSSNPPLTRTRSLRKPTPGTATDLSLRSIAPATPTASATTARRNMSPSRLPSLRPVARSTSTAAAAAAKEAPARRTRPVSGTLVRPPSVTSKNPTATSTTSSTSMTSTSMASSTSTSTTSRPLAATANSTARPQQTDASRPRYPPNASSSAAATVKRPTSSGGLPVHTRTRSTTTAPARSQGHVRARSTVTASSTPSLPAASAVNRPPSAGPTSHPTRPPSAHARLARQPTTASTTATAATTANPTTNPPRLLQKKPAFSTLQQHYSPQRTTAPKPATASYLAPPSPSKLPANLALTAETARLQTTLLQLHLLHRDAPATAADWRASARDRLAARHRRLAARHATAAAAAAAAATARNVAALPAWHAAAARLEHTIPPLDAALAALPGLETSHDALARRFARWAARVPHDRDALLQALDLDALQQPLDLDDQKQSLALLAGPLDATWHADAARHARKLDTLLLRPLAALPAFPAPHAAADAARALEACAALARGMLDELAVMRDVERAAVEDEAAWIRRVNREDGDARREGPRPGAVWRVI